MVTKKSYSSGQTFKEMIEPRLPTPLLLQLSGGTLAIQALLMVQVRSRWRWQRQAAARRVDVTSFSVAILPSWHASTRPRPRISPSQRQCMALRSANIESLSLLCESVSLVLAWSWSLKRWKSEIPKRGRSKRYWTQKDANERKRKYAKSAKGRKRSQNKTKEIPCLKLAKEIQITKESKDRELVLSRADSGNIRECGHVFSEVWRRGWLEGGLGHKGAPKVASQSWPLWRCSFSASGAQKKKGRTEEES